MFKKKFGDGTAVKNAFACDISDISEKQMHSADFNVLDIFASLKRTKSQIFCCFM